MCIEKCPGNVVGIAVSSKHKHVVIKDPDACIGCKTCIKTCPHGVFSSSGETRERHKPKAYIFKRPVFMTVFLISAITGIGLHLAGHDTDREVWHNRAVAHIISSLLWLVFSTAHIIKHRFWYRDAILKGISKRDITTLMMTIIYVVVIASGIILTACVDGANSGIGMWHYRLGLLLAALCTVHIRGREA